jgi:hypothetical protein
MVISNQRFKRLGGIERVLVEQLVVLLLIGVRAFLSSYIVDQLRGDRSKPGAQGD